MSKRSKWIVIVVVVVVVVVALWAGSGSLYTVLLRMHGKH